MEPKLIANFNRQFPVYAVLECKGTCVLKEKERSASSNGEFGQLTITDIDCWHFPHNLPKDNSSFYAKSVEGIGAIERCHELMLKDCDGIFCVEEQGKLVFYVCELKSSYIKDNIVKAKDQIVGSCLKLDSLLSILQGYDKDLIEYRGVIIAYEADTERLSSFNALTDRGAAFCIKLYKDGAYHMPKEKCEAYWKPLRCYDIEIGLVKVSRGNTAYQVRLNDIIRQAHS